MAAVEISRRDGGTARLESAELDALEGAMRGGLGRPGDPAYDDACAIWNGMIRRRPALTARCLGASDVRHVLEAVRRHGLHLSVRAAGHNIAGKALCDDGVVLDLSGMRSVRIDPEGGRVRVEPGANWGDVDRETLPLGRAVPGGIVSTTGVSGLTLGGGFGWLSRAYGLSCDNVLSVDVVTADGSYLTAGPERNPELFWALMGGGGGYGVVTSFEYRARPAGPEVLAGLVLHPASAAPELLRFYREFAQEAPEELGSLALLRYAPPAPFLPPEVHGAPVCGIGVCWIGDPDEGDRVIAPLRAFGEPLADVVGRKPFTAIQTMFDAANPSGRHYYWKSEYLAAVDDGLIDVLAARGSALSSKDSAVLLMQQGGAIGRGDRGTTSAANRDAAFILNLAGSWRDPAESEEHVAFTRAFWEEVRPFSTGGTYVNFLTEDDGARYGAALGGVAPRLHEVKAEWDPDGVFPAYLPVPPAAGSAAS